MVLHGDMGIAMKRIKKLYRRGPGVIYSKGSVRAYQGISQGRMPLGRVTSCRANENPSGGGGATPVRASSCLGQGETELRWSRM